MVAKTSRKVNRGMQKKARKYLTPPETAALKGNIALSSLIFDSLCLPGGLR